jgi:hypothetical protein
VGKGKLFWFFSVGFACRQKPNVLDRVVDFFFSLQVTNDNNRQVGFKCTVLSLDDKLY